MKKLLASAAAAALVTSPAFAGALIFEPEPEPVVAVAPAPAPAPIPTWTGPYAGIHLGWGEADVDVGLGGAGVGTIPGADGPTAGFIPNFSTDDDGVVYGAQVGYDYDFGNGFVLGVEASYSRADAEPSTTVTILDGDGDPIPVLVDPDDPLGDTFNATVNASAEIDHIVRLTARGGYSLGNTLLYVKGGAAWMDGDYSFGPESGSADEWGWVAGAGVEHLITDNISAGVEYLYTEIDDFGRNGIDVEMQTVAARLNFRF